MLIGWSAFYHVANAMQSRSFLHQPSVRSWLERERDRVKEDITSSKNDSIPQTAALDLLHHLDHLPPIFKQVTSLP